jgi:FAD binding domain
VQLFTNTPAALLLTEDGAVTGAVLAAPEGELTVRARCGVLLAAGGFPNDVARRRKPFPRTATGLEHWTLAPTETYRSGRVGTYPRIVDRGKPGLIAVLSNGKRFVNEADGYYQFSTAMIASVPAAEAVLAWLICDHAFQRRYPFGMSKPFPVPVWPYVRSGHLKRGRTLEDLVRKCGIDPAGLTSTVASFNKHALVGEDPEFGRGISAFNRGSGDPEHQPNPSLAPIEKGPFYAIKVLPGSFGTFAV